jgi:hypothetical protein
VSIVIGGGDEKLGLWSAACGFDGQPAATAARSAAAWAAAGLELAELLLDVLLDVEDATDPLVWWRAAVVEVFDEPELAAK